MDNVSADCFISSGAILESVVSKKKPKKVLQLNPGTSESSECESINTRRVEADAETIYTKKHFY